MDLCVVLCVSYKLLGEQGAKQGAKLLVEVCEQRVKMAVEQGAPGKQGAKLLVEVCEQRAEWRAKIFLLVKARKQEG